MGKERRPRQTEPERVTLPDRDWSRGLKAKITEWIDATERLHLSEYVRYMENRKRRMWNHFLGGVARGVGMAVGFTILGAVLVMLLQSLAKRNLPVIGDFLAQIVSVVQKRLQ